MTGDATSSDPFATLQLGKKDLAATPAIKGTLNPVWDFSKVAKIAKDWVYRYIYIYIYLYIDIYIYIYIGKPPITHIDLLGS